MPPVKPADGGHDETIQQPRQLSAISRRSARARAHSATNRRNDPVINVGQSAGARVFQSTEAALFVRLAARTPPPAPNPSSRIAPGRVKRHGGGVTGKGGGEKVQRAGGEGSRVDVPLSSIGVPAGW